MLKAATEVPASMIMASRRPAIFGSFRDPLGRVVLNDTAVWRLVNTEAAEQVSKFLDLDLIKEWQRIETLVQTRPAEESEFELFSKEFGQPACAQGQFRLFRHTRLSFPSFPYEWSPEMLRDAGRLTLEIAELCLEKTGWCLKDATPFNVLFRGPSPVFIDLLSFERRDAKDPIWLPYNQFVQTFLLPLLVNKEIGMSLQSIFLTHRDGLPVAEAAKFFTGMRKLKPRVVSLVTLPHLLSGRAEGDAQLYNAKNLDSAEKARFILGRSFHRLRKHLDGISADEHRKSTWSAYTKYNQEAIPEYMHAKQAFLTRAIDELKPHDVLDVGCNTGFFSLLAARTGASVVAIDHDEVVVGRTYEAAKKENLDVLPLIVNLSRPTPRIGWRFSENPSFLDRAIGHFDLVMMLAVVHHMLVQERIPLREIFRLAADLTKDALIVEFVPTSDKMFQRLARGREHLHQDLTAERFAETAGEFFNIARSEQLPQSERKVYLMRKK